MELFRNILWNNSAYSGWLRGDWRKIQIHERQSLGASGEGKNKQTAVGGSTGDQAPADGHSKSETRAPSFSLLGRSAVDATEPVPRFAERSVYNQRTRRRPSLQRHGRNGVRPSSRAKRLQPANTTAPIPPETRTERSPSLQTWTPGRIFLNACVPRFSMG